MALSGHSHYSIDDERSIWQGAFTSVNCGCARGFAFTFPGRENGHAVSDMKAGTRFQMSPINIKRIRQGMLMEVFEDRIVFHRREFVNDRTLGPDWVVPVGEGAPRPYEFEPRRRASQPPQFAEGATVALEDRPDGRDRAGMACEQVAVAFPQAGGAFDYEVNAIARMSDFHRVCISKRVFAPDAFLGAKEGAYLVSFLPMLCLCALFCLPALSRIRLPKALRGACCVLLLLLCVASLAGDGYHPFLYFRF